MLNSCFCPGCPCLRLVWLISLPVGRCLEAGKANLEQAGTSLLLRRELAPHPRPRTRLRPLPHKLETELLREFVGSSTRATKVKVRQHGGIIANWTELRQESCPGPLRSYAPSVAWIFRHQHPQDCDATKALVSQLGGVFGGGLVGLAAQLGPATWLLGNALSSGRVFHKETSETANDLKESAMDHPFYDTSAVFEAWSNCSVPAAQEIRQARNWPDDNRMGLRLEDKVMKWDKIWYHPPSVTLINDTLNGFRMTGPYYRAAASMYLLRLTNLARQNVEAMLRESLPDDFDPSRAISMPIRDSDKCRGESECLNFSTYMEFAEEIRRFDPNVRDIILTSETARIMDKAFDDRWRGRWRFIVNNLDLQNLPGTGTQDKPAVYSSSDLSASPHFLAISSLHLQMRGRYFVLNTNSHWNTLIGLLATTGGCSMVSDPIVLWLSDQEPKYLVCGIVTENNPICAERARRKEGLKRSAQ